MPEPTATETTISRKWGEPENLRWAANTLAMGSNDRERLHLAADEIERLRVALADAEQRAESNGSSSQVKQ